MYILIDTNGKLSVEQSDDMKRFCIVDKTQGENLSSLLDVAEPAEENHYWIDADAVIALSPQGKDPQWCKNFWSMLKAVEPYGYSDLEKKRIKAHIET